MKPSSPSEAPRQRFLFSNRLSKGFHGILCFLILLCSVVYAAEPVRLAVISTDESGWSDLLTARLSQQTNIVLVERTDLGKVLDELAIQDLFANRKNRIRLGEIAGTDFLAILNVDKNRIRLVVCDTRLGITLQELDVDGLNPPGEAFLDTLENTTMGAIDSFAEGVQHIIAVPDFVCRDLTFDHTFLQSDLAELLRSAYLQIPGVAIVAIEEAKDIAAERDLANIQPRKRLVSVFVEGEYRTTRADKGDGVRVGITLRVRDSERVLLERKLPLASPSQVGRELMVVFAADLARQIAPGEKAIDEEAQYRMLLAQAGKFSEIGEYRRSTELREAALLLRPDTDPQRIKLIQEYTRQNNRPYETHSWPKGAKFDESNPLWVAATNRSIDDWKRSLQHCEYLITKGQISREEATSLAYEAIRSICGVRVRSSHLLTDCEVLKKAFLRHAFARVAYLEPASPKVRSKLSGALEVYTFIFEIATFRCDGTFYKNEDLDLIADLLIHRLPDSILPSNSVSSFLRSAASWVKQEQNYLRRFSVAEYHAFLDRLVASDRPLVRLYGRYGKFQILRVGSSPSPALLAEAQSIVEAASALGPSVSGHHFMTQLKDEVSKLTRALRKETVQIATQPQEKSPAAEPDPPVPALRVALEPISLRVMDSAVHQGKIFGPNLRWKSRLGGVCLTRYQPLTDDLDAIWGYGAVLFMPRSGELIEVLADEKLEIASVACDGKYVWVAARSDWGISVLDLHGRELTRIGREHGLPPNGWGGGLVVHPIEHGRVLVAGSFGNENRGWIAVVEFDGKKNKVRVIHEATNVRNYRDPDDRYSQDPAKTFVPTSIVEHTIPGDNSERIFYVQRAGRQPLIVDPEDLTVKVYSATPKTKNWFPGRGPPSNAYLSSDGILWVAGSGGDFSSFRLNVETELFETVRKPTTDWIGLPNSGSLVRDGDWLYYTGCSKWRRLNLQTGVEELLVEDSRALPHYGSGGAWRLYVSAHYGLVAFFEDRGELYRLGVTSEKARDVQP